MVKTSRTRDLRFEILRIIAMLIIIASHAAWNLSWMLHAFSGMEDVTPNLTVASYYTVGQWGQVGVVIFFIITGYFLCNKQFTAKRVVKSIMQVFFYSITVLLVTLAAMHLVGAPEYIKAEFTGSSLLLTMLHAVLPILTNTYWFMTAYVVLLFLQPFINKLIDNISKKQFYALIGLLSVLALWMEICGFAGLFGSIEYAVLCYLLGVWVSKYSKKYKKYFTWPKLVAYIVIGFVVVTLFNLLVLKQTDLGRVLDWLYLIQISNGLRVVSIFIGLALVTTFINNLPVKLLHSRKYIVGIVTTVSVATFGVYMLHEHLLIRRWVWLTMSSLSLPTDGILKVLALAVVVLIVYLVATIIAIILDKAVHAITKCILNTNACKTMIARIDAVIR